MFGMGKRTTPAANSETKTRTSRKSTPVPVTIRLAPEQRDKLQRLGGEAWVQEQIERADEGSSRR